MKTGIAYPAFIYQFRRFFPDIQVIESEEVKDYDLIIFSGGEDINPAIYGQENRYSSFNIVRDAVEIKILRLALEMDKKILGVCRGHQLINAYLGGELIQDIVSEKGMWHLGWHPIKFINDGGNLINFFPNGVNSMHHQAVKIPGENLIPTSLHEDKTIESTESNNIITTQWHPEFMNTVGTINFFNYLHEWRTK